MDDVPMEAKKDNVAMETDEDDTKKEDNAKQEDAKKPEVVKTMEDTKGETTKEEATSIVEDANDKELAKNTVEISKDVATAEWRNQFPRKPSVEKRG